MTRWEKGEIYILLATVIVGGVISILDLVGALDSVIWLKDRVPAITLLIATLIASSLYIGSYNTREFLKSVLPTGAVTKFGTVEEAQFYILKRIKQASSSVYDITWLPHLKPGVMIGVMASTEDREKYLQAIERVSSRIPYREIMMFCGSASRVDKARRLIEQAGEYYQLAVYPDLPSHAPPRWQFLVIDEEEVILPEWMLAIRQPEIVAAFCQYYQRIWEAAILIGAARRTESKKRLEEAISQYYAGN